jgi:flagellum-specific ATP synthase
VQRARGILASRREVEELKSLGAYTAGANPAHDEALALGARLDGWSAQASDERSSLTDTFASLAKATDRRKS